MDMIEISPLVPKCNKNILNNVFYRLGIHISAGKGAKGIEMQIK
jgi:hypothetical protein